MKRIIKKKNLDERRYIYLSKINIEEEGLLGVRDLDSVLLVRLNASSCCGFCCCCCCYCRCCRHWCFSCHSCSLFFSILVVLRLYRESRKMVGWSLKAKGQKDMQRKSLCKVGYVQSASVGSQTNGVFTRGLFSLIVETVRANDGSIFRFQSFFQMD